MTKLLGVLFFFSFASKEDTCISFRGIDLCIGFHSPHGWELIIDWIDQYQQCSSYSDKLYYKLNHGAIYDTIKPK
ncbi:hypothetical protein [Enterobacter hormaechei]|uniref:hypothetical protein n=1 Tax=Enterobacter hormaechei TaxID=158836 RepID=UPI003CC518B4